MKLTKLERLIIGIALAIVPAPGKLEGGAKDIIPAESLQDDAVETAKIKALNVSAAKLAANAVETTKIKDANVTAAKLASDAVETAKLKDLAVTTGKLAADAVTGAKIADDAVDSEHYTDSSIDTAHLAAAQVVTSKLSAAAKIKRAHSNALDTAVGDAIVGLIYTSTAITITSVKVYTIAAIVGANFVLDVGINADDDAIVADEAIGATNIDTVVDCTIDTPDVVAGKMITASVSTADGTSGKIVIAIEYYENE